MFAVEQPGEYRTRDGRKAVVPGYHPYGTEYRRWIGYIGDHPSEWSDEGGYQPGEISDRDLLGPWEQVNVLGTLVEAYLAQRGEAFPEVNLDRVLRAIAAEIDAINAARSRR